MRHPWKAGIALLLALSLTGAACGGRDDDSSDGGSTDDGGTEAPAESAGFINPDEDCEDYDGTAGVEGNTIKIGRVEFAVRVD